jgi:DNA primase
MGIVRESDINEIRERSDLVEVVSDYVKLKKAGRSFKGLCPFHKEKTPSFFVDPLKQLYHCFGCGEGGNVFTFVMKMEKVEFPEAVKLLAERIGYEIKYEKGESKNKSFREKLFSICEEAAKFYENYLWGSEGKKAQGYLKERGFSEEVLKEFRLGFSPSQWSIVTNYLYKKGFTSEELVSAGISIQGEKSFYDRFRRRIIFPIFDLKGRVVGFGGRILDSEGEEEPKYLNSPETPIFKKGSLLYGLYQAKREIVSKDEVIVVEGYTDVLALHQEGVKNSVATLGTAFTVEHFHALSRISSKVLLAFDADTAGKTAAQRGIELLSEGKSEIYVVRLPAGKDPADLAKEKEKFSEIFNQHEPLAQFCIEEKLKDYSLENRSERIKALQEALSVVRSLPSYLAQEEYIRFLSERFNFPEEVLRLELKRGKRYNKQKLKERVEELEPHIVAEYKREEELLKIFLKEADLAKEFMKQVQEEYFQSLPVREAFSCLSHYFESGKEPNLAEEMDKLSEETKSLLARLMLEDVTADNKKVYLSEILVKIKDYFLREEIAKLKKKLSQDSSSRSTDVIFEEIYRLEILRRNLTQEV